MKQIISFLVFALITTTAFAQSSKTLVKTLNPDESKFVSLDFDGAVEVKEWKENTVRVLLDVSVDNVSEKILKGLIAAGRYNLKTEKVGDNFKITVPGLRKEVKLRGELLTETITAVVYVPEYVETKIEQNGANSTVLIEKGANLEKLGFVSKGTQQEIEEIDYQVTIRLSSKK